MGNIIYTIPKLSIQSSLQATVYLTEWMVLRSTVAVPLRAMQSLFCSKFRVEERMTLTKRAETGHQFPEMFSLDLDIYWNQVIGNLKVDGNLCQKPKLQGKNLVFLVGVGFKINNTLEEVWYFLGKHN